MRDLTPLAAVGVLRRDPRLILPVGALDPHGPHLPLGTDTLIVDRLADDLSAATGVLRAPTVEYGVNAPGGGAFGGATLRKKTLHRLLNDLLNAWEEGGVGEFVLLTAHRHDPHQEALATVVTLRARVRVVDVLGVDVCDLLDGQDEPMHADEVDTSLILHLAPGLVRPDAARDNMVSREVVRRFRAGRRVRTPAGADAPHALGRPSLASAAKGARIYARLLERIGTRVLGAAPEALRAVAPGTFADAAGTE